ncbi:universal stress protein [Humibacter sp.]|uniref:universal stress protein n=1 Tax=Humibacter sp. TaxID=1940291 RepID=UPI003F80BF4E
MENERESRPILVGVDGSRSSIEALRLAAELSKALGHHLEAVTAWDYPALAGYYVAGEWRPDRDGEGILDASIAEAFGPAVPSGMVRTLRKGSPAGVLVEESRRAEMLVVGCRGRGGFVGLLLGSVSAECAEHAQCPVLVVHSDHDAAHTKDENGSV